MLPDLTRYTSRDTEREYEVGVTNRRSVSPGERERALTRNESVTPKGADLSDGSLWMNNVPGGVESVQRRVYWEGVSPSTI